MWSTYNGRHRKIYRQTNKCKKKTIIVSNYDDKLGLDIPVDKTDGNKQINVKKIRYIVGKWDKLLRINYQGGGQRVCLVFWPRGPHQTPRVTAQIKYREAVPPVRRQTPKRSQIPPNHSCVDYYHIVSHHMVRH